MMMDISDFSVTNCTDVCFALVFFTGRHLMYSLGCTRRHPGSFHTHVRAPFLLYVCIDWNMYALTMCSMNIVVF